MINIDTRLLEQVTDANQLFLLMHISKRVNSATNQCFPSNATLQADTGWSRTKVYEVRQQLIDLGLIEIKERRKDNDRSQSSIITLNTDYISFFVTAKKHTKNFKNSDAPPSATANAPVRQGEPTPSATADTEHINQLNILTIEHNKPLTPFKKGEQGENNIEDELSIDSKVDDWIECWQNTFRRVGIFKPHYNIDRKQLARNIRKWDVSGRDYRDTLRALMAIAKDPWQHDHNYPSAAISKLFRFETVDRFAPRIRASDDSDLFGVR